MLIETKEIIVTGRMVKTAKLKAEYYECIDEPRHFIDKIKSVRTGADLFTFLQDIGEPIPRFPFHLEWDTLAVLTITTYDNWWKNQIKDKTRNMVRKAQKSGVEIKLVDFDDDLIRGIMEIHNESPVRQGRRFWHYGKDFNAVKEAHETFIERSEFIGAYLGKELIGFVKLVHGKNASSLMQILSKIAHRNKAPTNGLLAKAVEICAQKKVPYLHYGIWGRRSLNEFKIHHAFEPKQVARYFVPLNLKGKLALNLNLHHALKTYVPKRWMNGLGWLRSRWFEFRYSAAKNLSVR